MEFDRERMQNEIYELRCRMDNIGLQKMSQSGVSLMHIKKEDPFEAEVPKTPTSLTNQQK